jgi:hypothetical protein
MLDIDAVGRETSRPIEALIADVALVSKADLPRVVKQLGPNRPLILTGARGQAVEDVPRDATWMARPVTRENFLLSVALGLAEGRPSRRSPRVLVPKLMSMIDGVSSKVVDVSVEGVRLEITGGSPHNLPPFFTLKVPSFGIAAKVKRVWVAMPAQGSVWCGGIIEKQNAKQTTNWQTFIANAPITGQKILETSAGI